MRVEVELRGVALDRQAALIERAMPEATAAAAQELASSFTRWLNQPGSGVEYPSRTGAGTHRASAPGEPPAPDRGELRDSVQGRSDDTSATVTVASPAGYLDQGTSRIAPRPFVDRAIDDAMPGIADAIVGVIAVAIREE